jgi:hypothetical protein
MKENEVGRKGYCARGIGCDQEAKIKWENKVKVNLSCSQFCGGAFGVGRFLVKIGQASGTICGLKGSTVDLYFAVRTRPPACETATWP